MNKECATCQKWKRDGADGICYAETPKPIIVPEGQVYMLIRPRTQPDDPGCNSYDSIIPEIPIQ